MVIFYHGDMDGIASANIFFNKMDFQIRKTVHFFEFDYSKEDAILNTINTYLKSKEFIFVDCCPSENILKHLTTKSKKVIILDHHITKKELIDTYIKEGLIKGMSYIGASATLITWAWFTFNENLEEITIFLDKYCRGRANQDKTNVPLAIKLVNSWDIWDGLYIDAEPYKVYFETQRFDPSNEAVKKILENNIEINKAIREGNIMMKFYHNWGQQYCERYGYEVQYLKYNFFVLNVGNANSKIFGDLINQYDAVIIYCNDGIKYKCSIYSSTGFDCANLAEQFGGGGHKGAAGFSVTTLPTWLRDKKSALLMKGENK